MSEPRYICRDCGWRGGVLGNCPKCGSANTYVYEELAEVERRQLAAWKLWAAT